MLVPRPDTETLIEVARERLAGGVDPAKPVAEGDGDPPVAVEAPRVADIGTGSGAIALTLAKLFPAAAVFAVDISPAALEVARGNAERLGLAVTFVEGDLGAPLAAHGPFSLLVANLPYIPSGDLAALPAEVRVEPTLALDGGPDGLALVRRLIAEAARAAGAGRGAGAGDRRGTALCDRRAPARGRVHRRADAPRSGRRRARRLGGEGVSADGAAVVTPAAPAGAQPSDGSTAAKGAVFIGGAKIYFMLSGFLQQVLLTRLVGLAEFGAFAVVNNVISIVNNTVVQATIQSVSKFTAEDDARAGAVQRAGVKMQAALGAVLALAIFFGAPLIAAFEEAPRYTTYFRIAAVIPFLYALYAVFVGSANGLRRFRTQASFDVGFSTAKTILLLGLAALWKVTGAFVGFAAAAAFILVVASRVMRLPSPAQRFPMKRLAGFMSAVVAYGLLLNVALNYDLPLLHHFAGKSAGGAAAAVVAGHYQALRTLALLPYQALVVVTFVIFPLDLARHLRRRPRGDAPLRHADPALRAHPRGAHGDRPGRAPGRAPGRPLQTRVRRRGGGDADPGRRRVLPGPAGGRLRDPECRGADQRDASRSSR